MAGTSGHNWLVHLVLVVVTWLPAAGVYAPAGYNGRGIGTGTVMGQYLAQLLSSGNRDDFPFPIEDLCRENWRGARTAYYDYGTLSLQLLSHRW